MQDLRLSLEWAGDKSIGIEGVDFSMEGNATPLSTVGGSGTAGLRFKPKPCTYPGGSVPAMELIEDEELLEELRMSWRGLDRL